MEELKMNSFCTIKNGIEFSEEQLDMFYKYKPTSGASGWSQVYIFGIHIVLGSDSGSGSVSDTVIVN